MKQHACRLSLIALLAACQGPAAPTSQPDPAQPPPADLAIGPALRAQLTQHAVLAFRQDGAAIVGGYRTHHSSVQNGIIALTPYTFPGGERTAHAPITLETASIMADNGQIGGPVSETHLDDGRIVLQRGTVTERLGNEPEGLHQEWSFAAAPQFPGDVTVEVAVSGYRYSSTTSHGLHFVSGDGVGVRYSNAVWSDSAGHAWPIPATYDSGSGHIQLIVPESVVAATTFPALLDPTVSAEVAADAPVVGPAGQNQTQVAIAFGGGEYLAVWSDNRDSADADIWATRLSAAGAIIDSLGIKVNAAVGPQSNPTVAYNGSTFVVAWEDFLVHGGSQADIKATTVSTAGAVGATVTVASTTTSETKPVIAARSDGNALLTWNAAGTLMGSIYSGGTFGTGFTIASGTRVERAGVAANPGGNYLVSFASSTTNHLSGQLVTTAGATSGAAFAISSTTTGAQSQSSATFDGTNFDVVWVNNSAGAFVYGARVSATGTVLDVGGVALNATPASSSAPSIKCQSTGCFVAWQDARNNATTGYDVYGQLVTTSMTLSGTAFVVANAANSQIGPVVASSGSGYFTAWTDLRDDYTYQVFGSTVSSTGTVGANAPIGTGDNREAHPTLGRAGGTFALFWGDSRTYSWDIRYVRFSASGGKLDTTAQVASAGANAQSQPEASADLGTNTLVVWSDTRSGTSRDIYGARVDLSTPSTLDPAGIAITTAAKDQVAPAVASNGSVALVVWEDYRNNVADIYGAIVGSAGTVTVPEFVISNATGNQNLPAVTWDPTSSQFIVVWEDLRNGSTYGIYGTRVSTAGAVLDPTGVLISGGTASRLEPAITSTSTNSFVAWQDRRNAPAGGYNIYGSRVTGGSALTVVDAAGIKVSNNTSKQTAPTIGAIGSSYVVLWADDRAGNSDIYGQQVAASSGALSGTEFVVSNAAYDELAPVAFGNSGNSTAVRVAYEARTLDSSRVETRVITTQTDTGSVCTSNSQCVTGFCVDGYCCDTACEGPHYVAPGPGTTGSCEACASKYTGQANGTCSVLPATAMCRDYASTYCDHREYCDGTTATCPPDTGINQGNVCNKSSNRPSGTGTGVCPANDTTGAPHFCN